VLLAAATLLASGPLTLPMGGVAKVVGMPAAPVAMMSWPQLVTAVAGGLLAFAVLRLRK
jgi:hypothetical protein